MLSNTIGADVFQMALINYIQQNAYGNADDQTLWTVITQVRFVIIFEAIKQCLGSSK
jgi:aminopeptidase N